MTLVDLSRRLTHRFEDFEHHLKSSDSLIFLEGTAILDDGPASLELTVGDGWFQCSDNRYYLIPEEGIRLKPRSSVVVETSQVIGLPLNVCGLVTGKGKFIFQGVFVSSGKIDPGFCSKLRIGLYNGGNDAVTIKKGEPFSYCCFFNMETHLDVSRRKGDLSPRKLEQALPRTTRLWRFLKTNWPWIATTLIALASLLVAIFKR